MIEFIEYVNLLERVNEEKRRGGEGIGKETEEKGRGRESGGDERGGVRGMPTASTTRSNYVYIE